MTKEKDTKKKEKKFRDKVLGIIESELRLSELPKGSANLRDDLAVDSLDMETLIMALEDNLHIDIPDKDRGMWTDGDLTIDNVIDTMKTYAVAQGVY